MKTTLLRTPWLGLLGGLATVLACSGDATTIDGAPQDTGDDAGPASSSGTASSGGSSGAASSSGSGGSSGSSSGGGNSSGSSSGSSGGGDDGGSGDDGGGGGSSGGDSGDGGSSSGAGLNPNVAPGGNFDLTGWQLQLPIGSAPGSPTFIPGSQLAGDKGFTNIYFFTDKSDGAMTLMDPTTGITTGGSLHPRSELREVTNGWSTAGTNTQTVTLAVPEVPGTVAIGQIFQAPPAPSKPLLELQYVKGGKVQVLLENTNQGGNATPHPVGTVADGSQFTYVLSLTGTTIAITLNGTTSTFTLPSSFVGENFYFKCGDYDQTATAGTPGTTPGTVVKVYALDVVHK